MYPKVRRNSPLSKCKTNECMLFQKLFWVLSTLWMEFVKCCSDVGCFCSVKLCLLRDRESVCIQATQPPPIRWSIRNGFDWVFRRFNCRMALCFFRRSEAVSNFVMGYRGKQLFGATARSVSLDTELGFMAMRLPIYILIAWGNLLTAGDARLGNKSYVCVFIYVSPPFLNKLH